tara:strand:- start:428 stop:700 length:273 start_codon:yes stop_codon:yes gene_type:complete
MKKYLLTTHNNKIQRKEIEKENDCFFWVGGMRYAKAVKSVLLFTSYQGAKEYLVSHIEGKIQALEVDLIEQKEILKRIENQAPTGEKKEL